MVPALGDQLVVGVRVASAVAAADRTLGDAPTSKPHLIDWQSMSGRTSSCPSLSQQWTCIVITVTNVRGLSAYVCHSDHTVTEVSQSNVPQRSSHHMKMQLRTGLSRASCDGMPDVPRFYWSKSETKGNKAPRCTPHEAIYARGSHRVLHVITCGGRRGLALHFETAVTGCAIMCGWHNKSKGISPCQFTCDASRRDTSSTSIRWSEPPVQGTPTGPSTLLVAANPDLGGHPGSCRPPTHSTPALASRSVLDAIPSCSSTCDSRWFIAADIIS